MIDDCKQSSCTRGLYSEKWPIQNQGGSWDIIIHIYTDIHLKSYHYDFTCFSICQSHYYFLLCLYLPLVHIAVRKKLQPCKS